MDRVSKASVCGFYSLSGIGKVTVGKNEQFTEFVLEASLTTVHRHVLYCQLIISCFLNAFNLVVVLRSSHSCSVFLGQSNLGDHNPL